MAKPIRVDAKVEHGPQLRVRFLQTLGAALRMSIKKGIMINAARGRAWMHLWYAHPHFWSCVHVHLKPQPEEVQSVGGLKEH